ncbi:hypothetical protein LM4423_90289 [Listeria monocytogenes 4423]|nr:hypothetical protein LM4423_90289 [Listeria monocytogenes 4423]
MNNWNVLRYSIVEIGQRRLPGMQIFQGSFFVKWGLGDVFFICRSFWCIRWYVPICNEFVVWWRGFSFCDISS